MKLYLLSQDTNDGYDTYDSCVVAAVDHVEAVRISPDRSRVWSVKHSCWMLRMFDGKLEKDRHGTWVDDLSLIKVEQIGVARDGVEQGVICASFNAG